MYGKQLSQTQGGDVETNQKERHIPVSCHQKNQRQSWLPEEIITPFHQCLIAVIDDSPTVRKILEVCLGREGYHVRSFADGIELLSWLMSPEARIPALMVVDVNLPKMDGYTLMRHLKAKSAFAETVFIVLTGCSGMLDRLKGRLSGAQVYLTKPFRTDAILAVVHTYLGPMQMKERTEDRKVTASQ